MPKKDNLRYLFHAEKKLVATSILVFVIIFAMIGLVKYAQGVGLTAAILNGALMAVVGVLILVGINIAAAVWRINGYYKQKKANRLLRSPSRRTKRASTRLRAGRLRPALEPHRRGARNAACLLHFHHGFPRERHAQGTVCQCQRCGGVRALLEKNVAKTRLKLKRA
ncbi:MAG: hypothetical protein R2881_05020 [Eubacteriales bacterium]